MPAGDATDAERLRLGELLAALSLATDLGNGFPLEKALRNCLLAVGIGRELGMQGRDLSDVFYAGLLRLIGCTSFAHETARAYGDDVAMRHTYAPVDFGKPAEVMRQTFTQLARNEPPLRRIRTLAVAVTKGNALGREMVRADCEVAARLAERLSMSTTVARALTQMFERWDGKGDPNHLRGDAIEECVRVVHLAHEVEIFQRASGRLAAESMARERAGGWFDPAVVDAFLRRSNELLESTEQGSVWDLVLEAEPEPRPWVPASRLDDVARAFADFVDMKSPYTLGHSPGVAALAESAGRRCNLDEHACVTLRHAGLLHDLGRVSVSNGIWDKPGPLGSAEWERVRMHPYHSERILSQTPLLAHLSRLAGMHHERIDGSGYHRGAPHAMLDMPARILAAADAYHALTEPRPHREAMVPEQAARTLETEVAAGRIDRTAAGAVVESAGETFRAVSQPAPAGLTDREVEVLRLLARGLSKKEIAKVLFIAPGTVHTHVVHIYAKVGTSTRAGVAMFAMENGLVT